MAVSRVSRASQNMVTWVRGCLPDDVPALPEDPRAIVCLGPLDHFSHWLQGADLPGAPRIVAMSSMSAQSKRDSPVAAERELAARLQASEQRLLACCAERGSACTILRATLIYGGAGGSLEKLAARARRWHVFPSPQGEGRRQPVHADDLARAVWAAMDEPDGGGIIQAGGGERLSATAMFARVHAALAPQSLRVPLPSWMLRAVADVSGRGRGALARLPRDLIADNTKLVGLLGVEPRTFEPGLPRQG
jgi:nucleoside-diphosphate-sugar epimerase